MVVYDIEFSDSYVKHTSLILVGAGEASQASNCWGNGCFRELVVVLWHEC